MVFDPAFLLKTNNLPDGNTAYYYTTADTIAEVNTSGYFNNASDDLVVGDHITVSQKSALNSSAATIVASSIMLVLSNAAGVVDVSDGLVIPVTDSD